MGHGHHGRHAGATDNLRHEASAQVEHEVSATNEAASAKAAVRNFTHAFFPWMHGSGHGTGDPGQGKKGPTNFEERKLNEMIDLVKHADPSQLSHAAQSLWDARDAISDAAEELHGHVGKVDWHGIAGKQFQEWAAGLVTNARHLSKYASHAGTQLHVASSGLSSVRHAMPPRDERVDPKTVEEIPEPKRVKGNPEYDAAVKVEGHRQEAINQLNRLASFYTVASSSLAKEQPPEFKQMKNPGVPAAATTEVSGQGAGGSRAGALGQQGGASNQAPSNGIVPASFEPHGTVADLPDQQVHTEIDSAPPTPTLAPPPTDPGQPPISPAHGHTNPVNPITTGPGPMDSTGQRVTPKAFGKTTGPLGREEMAGGRNTNTTAGRGPMGRGPMGQTQAMGRGGTSGRMPMGRGISGGTPRATGPAKTSQAGAVRQGGVVGGRPNNGQTSGATSRVPRGTVIGGQQQSGGRVAGTEGKLGQRGVIGAQKAENSKTPSMRRAPGAPEGVVGAPKERTTGPKGERAGFTQGGSGLVRGSGEQLHESDRYHHDQADEHSPYRAGDGAEHQPPHAPPATD